MEGDLSMDDAVGNNNSVNHNIFAPFLPLNLRFAQLKGTLDSDVAEADIITVVEYDESGSYLATGDKGGRIVVFKLDQEANARRSARRIAPNFQNTVEYTVYTTFQSHSPEFDNLKSQEIEEKINQIRWLRPNSPSRLLLSCNDKTIKLWKLQDKPKKAIGFNFDDEEDLTRLFKCAFQEEIDKNGRRTIICEDGTRRHVNDNDFAFDENRINRKRVDYPMLTNECLKVPSMERMADSDVLNHCKREYSNAHTYHINSISVNSDQQTFMSVDDLRVIVWNLEDNKSCWTVVDLRPTNMDDLTEVITSGTFHPTQCHLFAYSSSKGIVRLCDQRQNALCDRHVKAYQEKDETANRGFFAEIIASLSDVKFSHDGLMFCTRDYLNVKVWDIRNERAPLSSHAVHDYLRGQLCSLYENDCIFDKFECCFSASDRFLLTGSYNNHFKIFDRETDIDMTFQASRNCIDTCGVSIPAKFAAMRVPSRSSIVQRNVDSNCLLDFASTRRVGYNGKNSILSNYQVPDGAARKPHVLFDNVSKLQLNASEKVIYSTWHPKEDVLAVAAVNNLYIFVAHREDLDAVGRERPQYE